VEKQHLYMREIQDAGQQLEKRHLILANWRISGIWAELDDENPLISGKVAETKSLSVENPTTASAGSNFAESRFIWRHMIKHNSVPFGSELCFFVWRSVKENQKSSAPLLKGTAGLLDVYTLCCLSGIRQTTNGK
jgi:hypothetical protein